MTLPDRIVRTNEKETQRMRTLRRFQIWPLAALTLILSAPIVALADGGTRIVYLTGGHMDHYLVVTHGHSSQYGERRHVGDTFRERAHSRARSMVRAWRALERGQPARAHRLFHRAVARRAPTEHQWGHRTQHADRRQHRQHARNWRRHRDDPRNDRHHHHRTGPAE